MSTYSPPRDPRLFRGNNMPQPSAVAPASPDYVVKFLIPEHRVVYTSHARLFGCKFQVASTCFPGSDDERAAIIVGPLSSIKSAVQSLIDSVEEDPMNPLLHLVIPSSAIPYILGNNGAVLRSLGSQSQTSINILPPLAGFEERVLRVSKLTPAGDSSCLALATSTLLQALVENGQVTSRIIDYASHSTGAATSMSAPAAEPTPAKSRIEALRDQLLKLAKVEQTGRQKDDLEQEWMMQQKLEATQQKAPAPLNSLGSTGGPRGFLGGPSSGRVSPSPRADANVVYRAADIIAQHSDMIDVKTMVRLPAVPNKACSALIGIHGRMVQELQDTTGAKIRVSGDYTPNSKEVVVTGPLYSVHSALIAIYDIIYEVEQGNETIGKDPQSLAVAQWLRDVIPEPQRDFKRMRA
jgi:KH domain